MCVEREREREREQELVMVVMCGPFLGFPFMLTLPPFELGR